MQVDENDLWQASQVYLGREVTIVGREIDRTPIPEPGSLLLLGSGLAAVGTTGAAGWRLRRRRREDA